jgi:transcriptional regulator with XRE-family HTH domain
MPPVATRQRLADVGAADARRVVGDIAREISEARRAAGTSQREAARRAGLSPSQYGRIERGELRRLTVEDACRAARAASLRCTVRCFPSDLRAHDAAQLSVLARLEALVAPPLAVRREVGVPIQGDLRAWDARVTDGRSNASVDAEARLGDLQALARRTALKQRDDPEAGAVILALSRTTHNRAILRDHREALRAQFPLDGAAIARALRRGDLPSESGIILV